MCDRRLILLMLITSVPSMRAGAVAPTTQAAAPSPVAETEWQQRLGQVRAAITAPATDGTSRASLHALLAPSPVVRAFEARDRDLDDLHARAIGMILVSCRAYTFPDANTIAADLADDFAGC